MHLKELIKNLQQLNNFDLLLILAFTARLWLKHKLTRLHPAHLILPIATLQVLFFIVAVGTATNVIHTLAVGNLSIAALALLPITLPRRPKLKAHWIK